MAVGAGTRGTRSLVSVLWALVVFSPLLQLLPEALGAVAADPSLLSLALPVDRRLDLLVRSLSLSGAVSIAAVTVGALAGSLLWRMDKGAAGKLRWLTLAFVPIPPYIHALSWMTTLTWVSGTAAGLGVNLPTTGWGPTYFVEFMTYLPLGTVLSLIGFMNIEAALVEAARLYRSEGEILIRVVLPLVAPSLVAAGGLIFAFTVTDYSVPALFSVNTYSLEVFSDFSATNQAARALILSTPVTAVTLLILWVSQASLRDAFKAGAQSSLDRHLDPPLWLKALQAAAVALVGAQAIVLLLSLAASSGGVMGVVYSASMASGDIRFTVFHSLATAAVCVPLALVAAERLNSGSPWWWLLTVIPLGVPAPLVGIGVIKLTSLTGLLYGTWVAPVLGTVVRFTPVSSLVTFAQLKRCDPLLFEAADLFKRSTAEAWLRIRLPLLSSGLAASAALVFAFTMGELGSTLLTLPPGAGALTVRVFNYLHYGSSDVVAGLCLLMAAVMILTGLAGLMLLNAGPRKESYKE